MSGSMPHLLDDVAVEGAEEVVVGKTLLSTFDTLTTHLDVSVAGLASGTGTVRIRATAAPTTTEAPQGVIVASVPVVLDGLLPNCSGRVAVSRPMLVQVTVESEGGLVFTDGALTVTEVFVGATPTLLGGPGRYYDLHHVLDDGSTWPSRGSIVGTVLTFVRGEDATVRMYLTLPGGETLPRAALAGGVYALIIRDRWADATFVSVVGAVSGEVADSVGVVLFGTPDFGARDAAPDRYTYRIEVALGGQTFLIVPETRLEVL